MVRLINSPQNTPRLFFIGGNLNLGTMADMHEVENQQNIQVTRIYLEAGTGTKAGVVTIDDTSMSEMRFESFIALFTWLNTTFKTTWSLTSFFNVSAADDVNYENHEGFVNGELTFYRRVHDSVHDEVYA
jgi:hypothetical protein